MLSFQLSVTADRFLSDDGSGGEPLFRTITRFDDVVIKGDQYQVAASLIDQDNRPPNTNVQTYTFRLHEAAGWQPRLTAFQFQKMLNDLRSIEIRSELLVGGKFHF